MQIVKIADENKSDFKHECERWNLSIFFTTSIVMTILMIGILTFQYLRLQDNLIQSDFFLFYIWAFFQFLIFSIIYYLYKKVKISHNQYIFDVLYVFLSLLLSVYSIYLELKSGPFGAMIYFSAIFIVISMVRIDIKFIFFSVIISDLTVLLSIWNSVLTIDAKISNSLSFIVAMILSLVLIIPFYNERLTKYNQKMELNNSNILLDLSNQQLGKLNKNLETISMTDSLTGIFNRLAFNEAININWISCLSKQSTLAIIMLDIDHFKGYNDFFGHIQGDSCLVTVAQTINSCLKRSDDQVFRYGGEEFIIILPGKSVQDAQIVGQRIFDAISSLKLPQAKDGTFVTVSAGIYSNIPTEAEIPQNFIHKADLALYTSKKNGRNQMTVYTKAMSATT